MLLVRAFETAPSAALDAADAASAGDEARRVEGEQAPFARWLARRGAIAAERIVDQEPAARAALRAARWPGWVAPTLVGAGFVLGIVGDAAGDIAGNARINILAPPMLALLAWNLVVYVLLAVRAFGRRSAGTAPAAPLRQMLATLARRAPDLPRDQRATPVGAFVRDWAGASARLYQSRFAAVLHAAAAAVAAGALLSLYMRGLAFEYRAGWDSTFLDANAVSTLLSIVLGPASALSGIALPGVDELAQLRFSAGGGENAARWIHLYAITIGLAVVVPRVLLAVAAAWRARGLARDFPLPADDAYFRKLERSYGARPLAVRVLPYSYTLSLDQQRALQKLLADEHGLRTHAVFADTVPMGGEDDLEPRFADAAPDDLYCAVFALTATPERENHGAFVRALVARAGAARVQVIVDESTFRQRFAGAGDFDFRRTQRRHAWEAMLRDAGRQATFVDLGAAP